MLGPAGLLSLIALGILVLPALLLFPGCGREETVSSVPEEGTGKPQVIYFWQPG